MSTNPAVEAVQRISAVPTMLKVITEMTGLRLSLVAKVTAEEWICCAVNDQMGFGLEVGGQLELATTLCAEVRACQKPILFGHASADPTYRDHHTPKLYNFESYIAVPIFLRDGQYFGNVCALDKDPRPVDDKTLRLFQLFAELVGLQLDAEQSQDATRQALFDERATSELREQFIAVLGHDLRSPLNAITLGTEALTLRAKDATDASLLRRIRNSAIRISRLVDDVLDFARGRLGDGVPLSAAPIDDVHPIFRQVVDELQAAHPERTVQVHAAGDGSLIADRTRLAQLLQNLLGNALTHSPPDAHVKVAIEMRAKELALVVENGGPPLPAEITRNMFAPFQRGPAGKGDGLGLGLYIASEIVRSHAGTIRAESDARATTVTVTIPRSI